MTEYSKNEPLVSDEVQQVIWGILMSTRPDYIKYGDVMTVLNGNEIPEWAVAT